MSLDSSCESGKFGPRVQSGRPQCDLRSFSVLSDLNDNHRRPRSSVDRARLLPCWALRPHNARAEDRARPRSVRTPKVPGYEYMQQGGASMLGVGETADYRIVLANLGDAWRIGVQTDVLGENLVAVVVPNSPNPLSSGVFLIAADRVRPARVSLAAAMGALRRCGTGSGTLFSELVVVGPT